MGTKQSTKSSGSVFFLMEAFSRTDARYKCVPPIMQNRKVSIRHQQKKQKHFFYQHLNIVIKKTLRQTENNFVNFYNVVVVCVVYVKKKNVEKIHQMFTDGLLMLKVCTDTDLK